MGTHHPIRKTVAAEPPVIPDKLYFRIGDVARLCEVPAYVLRFWETEFKQLKPNKGGTGQRLYRKKDVEMALRIKSLLYDQGYTIPGARQVFQTEARAKETAALPGSEPVAETSVSSITSASTESRVREMQQPEPQVLAREPHRDAALLTLRDDLRALLAELSKPIAFTPAAEVPPTVSVKAMRPQLVVEPKAEPAPKAKPKVLKPEPVRSKLQQGDLFGFDMGDDNPDPIAS